MAVEALKATPITNLDATPYVPNTTGEGAPGKSFTVDGHAVPSASASAGSTYQLVRVPSNAKIKTVNFESAAQGAGKFNISVYYSSSTIDGTAPANQGLIVAGTPGGDQFFASDIDAAAAVVITNVTNENGSYPINLRQQPLWQALGLATDPGGFFDIVAVVHTTAVTTGTGRLGITVAYVM